MKKRVSIKDIADKLGVSIALVSFVLNGQGQQKRVSAEMIRKILKTAKEMNYMPNQVARSLRKGSTNTFGLIVADIANPFFGSLARTIEDEALKYGFNVIIGSSDENMEKSETIIDTFLNRQVDGFIIIPVEGTEDQINSIIQKEIPLILVDRYFPNMPGISHVILDNYQATFESTNFLIRNGHKKISIIAYQSELTHMHDRIRGYEEAMKVNNLEKNIIVIKIPYTHSLAEIENTLDDLHNGKNKCDTIIFSNNLLSLSGLHCIKNLKLKIPDEISVLAFDENDAFDLYSPSITYVKQPLHDMGVEATKLLMDLINGSNKISHIQLKHTLVLNNSC